MRKTNRNLFVTKMTFPPIVPRREFQLQDHIAKMVHRTVFVRYSSYVIILILCVKLLSR